VNEDALNKETDLSQDLIKDEASDPSNVGKNMWKKL